MSYIAERRQEEKNRRRAEIVDAAESLYRELGWDAVTMQRVAKRARLSRTLVYVYFRDKRDLHFGIAMRALQILHAHFEQASSQAGTGLEKVEAIGLAYISFSQQYPHYFDACARFELHAPAVDEAHELETACMEAGKRLHDVVVDALLTGARDGSIQADLGELAVSSRVLWGFIHGIIQIARSRTYPPRHSGIAPVQLTQLAIDMLRDTLARPKPTSHANAAASADPAASVLYSTALA